MVIDINAFHLNLENTIILQRDSLGGDYYVNSGKTRQLGLETAVVFPLFLDAKNIQSSGVNVSHTWHNFNFIHLDPMGEDSSGKSLPGVARHTLSAGFTVVLTKGISTSLHYFFSDRIPLNDANSAFADPYHLLGIKMGYAFVSGSSQFRIQAGIDNILDELYSLGNDINGFGGRYYNAAAARNYYISLRWELKK